MAINVAIPNVIVPRSD